MYIVYYNKINILTVALQRRENKITELNKYKYIMILKYDKYNII